MISVERAAEIWDEIAPKYKDLLGLNRWIIKPKFEDASKDGVSAECLILHKYYDATLVFYLDARENEEHFMYCIQHEMLHVLHSSFTDMYETILNQFELSKTQQEWLGSLYVQSAEHLVHNLEYILDTTIVPYGYIKPDRRKDKKDGDRRSK